MGILSMEKQNKYTAIVILNYNNPEDTINCIRSVEHFNTAPIKYIVIDNGSIRKNSVTILEEFFSSEFIGHFRRYNENEYIDELPYLSFIVSSKNDGYAQGNNKGLHFAIQDNSINQILILNNDVLFVEDIISNLTISLESLPQAAIVSPILYKKNMHELDYNCARKNHSNWSIILPFLFLYYNFFGLLTYFSNKLYLIKNKRINLNVEHIEIELPSGSCMLFKKNLMSKIQIFDPGTFLYYEENILYKQIEQIKLKNYLIPRLKCIHIGASSTSKEKSYFVSYSSLKSATFYLEKYGKISFFQRMVFFIAKRFFGMKIFFLKLKQDL